MDHFERNPSTLPPPEPGGRRSIAIALDYVLNRAIPYDPSNGFMGYEWATERMVEIHPEALSDLQARMNPDRRPAEPSGNRRSGPALAFAGREW